MKCDRTRHGPSQVGLAVLLNLYYFLKPGVPQTTRFALRHWYTRPLRWMMSGSWPIKPDAAGVPEGWPGWPDGKSFAFVLSHDIEGRKGLERCRAIAEREMALGFRSAFYFVPEGEYETPPVLRSFLTERGFEVGVHRLGADRSTLAYVRYPAPADAHAGAYPHAGMAKRMFAHLPDRLLAATGRVLYRHIG